MGAEIRCGAAAPSATELREMGYTHILLAVGAWKPGKLEIPGNVLPVINWMKDVKDGKDVYKRQARCAPFFLLPVSQSLSLDCDTVFFSSLVLTNSISIRSAA